MNEVEKMQLLEKLDAERLGIIKEGEVRREFSLDRSECRIIALRAQTIKIPSLIAEEKILADKNDYVLEWKVYEHDCYKSLAERLLSAGFQAQDRESVLAYPITNLSVHEIYESLPRGSKIQNAVDENGLEGVAEISRQIGLRDVLKEKHRLSEILKKSPDEISIYILSVYGEAVSCLRAHYPANSIFAELAGARTKSTHRKKGFFTALVKHQISNIKARGRRVVIVDALPTSELILKRLGFEFLTFTQPFTYVPSAKNEN